MKTTIKTLGGLVLQLRSLAAGIIPASGSRWWWRGPALLLVSLSMPGLTFVPSPNSPAPTQISFEILQTTCGAGPLSYEFFLNGSSLGTLAGDDSQCDCNSPLQTFIVSDAALLAGAWNTGGSNNLRFVKNSGDYFSWVRATLDFPAGPMRFYYDFRGGDATNTDLCAGYTGDALDLNIGITYYRDVDEDGFGDPNAVITLLDTSPPTGYVTNKADCDDSDPGVTYGCHQPFDNLATGFTQELVASLPNDTQSSGYAFDSEGNVYVDSFANGHLYKIDMSTTVPLPSGIGRIHPITDLGPLTYRSGARTGVTTYGGNFTQYPDGTVYLNSWTGLGVVQVDLATASITSDPIPGAPDGNWGIVVDPQLNSQGHHSIWYQASNFISVVDPVDHRYLGNIPIGTDGFTVDPTGNYLFTTGGGMEVSQRVASDPETPDLPVFQHVRYANDNGQGGSPDGMAFATIGTKQVVVTNDAGAGTLSMFEFPNNDFTQPITRTVIASGTYPGEYGDQANVGPDGYFYITYWSGTRFPDGTTNGNGSVVRIGPAGRFLPATHSDNISLAPDSDSKPQGASEVLTATLVELDLETEETVPVAGISVTFTVVGGPDLGQTFTGQTDSNGQVMFTLLNQNGPGDDVVHAQFVDSNQNTQTSNNSVITFIVETNKPPVARCKNVTVSAGTDCKADASIDDGSSDPDTGDSITVTQSPAGPYSVGDTSVTLTVTDNHGASSTCMATVTVNDTTAPVFSGCPANITVQTGPNRTTCDQIASWTPPTVADCTAVTLTANHEPGATFPVGLTTVTYTVVDSATPPNMNTCSFTVTVEDNTVPVITCPSSKVVDAECPTGATVTYTAPTATDNCSVESIVNVGLASGSVFPMGDSTVMCTATDSSNNHATCSFTVHVNGAEEQLNDLVILVNDLPVNSRTKRRLGRQLGEVLSHGLMSQASCTELSKFVAMVQKMKKLTPAQATQLLNAAHRIQSVTGCRPVPSC